MSYWYSQADKEKKAKTGVIISEDSFIASDVFFDKRRNTKIEIGRNTTICEGTYLLCHDSSPRVGGFDTLFGNIKIGSNVFIGIKCIILMDTTIGDNVIIGAGSVVKGEIPSGGVWAGNPARFIKRTEEYLDEHKGTGNKIFEVPDNQGATEHNQ